MEKKIPVVSFDSILSVPGVTSLEQGDQKMAEATLEQLAKDAGGKGNIVKVWVAGFAPMERKQLAYQAFQKKYPDIKEIAAFGTAKDPALDTQTQMEAILKKYPNKGDITAYGQLGMSLRKALPVRFNKQDVQKLRYTGIDLSDEDLQLLQDPKSPWVASAAVDPKDIGRVQVRYLYQKLHGDQTPDKVVLEPVYVSRDQLPKDKQINTTQLSEYVKGWGGSQQGYTDWMKAAEKK